MNDNKRSVDHQTTTGGRNHRATTRHLPAWKKILFSAVSIVIFFTALELVLKLAGVRSVLYEEDPYVGFVSSSSVYVEDPESVGQAYLVTAPNKLKHFNPQRFLKTKPDGAYRIFTLGGSTTYGRPYDDMHSFSGWLRELLPSIDRSRHFEVINAGAISYASYRVARLMEELIEYDPDLFIVYSGHNEFLERRTYGALIEQPYVINAAGALLRRTRTFALIHSLLKREGAGKVGDSTPVLPENVETILDASVGPSQYHRDDAWKERVIEHYRFNLGRMVDIAHSAGAKVIFVAPALILGSCSPFKSEFRHDLTDSERKTLDELSAEAKRANLDVDLPAFCKAIEKALAIDQRSADLHFWHGRVLTELGQYEAARTALVRAVDEDVCPLRILPSMQAAIGEVAGQRRVSLLDFAAVVERESEHGIPGEKQFLDHVHLRVDGYQRLAVELIEVMRADGIVTAQAAWQENELPAIAAKMAAKMDPQANGRALRNLARVFTWAGRMDEAERVGTEAMGLLGDDAEFAFLRGRWALARGQIEDAIVHYRTGVERAPEYLPLRLQLASALINHGNYGEAVEELSQAVKLDSKDPHAWYLYGVALERLDRQSEAADRYRETIKLAPDHEKARQRLDGLTRDENRR